MQTSAINQYSSTMAIPLLDIDDFSDTEDEASAPSTKRGLDCLGLVGDDRPSKNRRISFDPIKEDLFRSQQEGIQYHAPDSRAFHDFRDWDDLFGKSIAIFQERDEIEEEKLAISSRESLIGSHAHRAMREGDIRLDAMESTYENFHMQPSELQRNCQWKFTNAVLQLIYKDSWEANRDRVMEERGLEKVKQKCMVSAPRRFGKTIATAQWFVACILNIPGIVIAVVSTGQRAAGWLTEKIAKAMKDVPGANERVVQQTATTIAVANRPLPVGYSVHSSVAKSMNMEHTTSRVTSYPCTVNSKSFIGEWERGSVCSLPPCTRSRQSESISVSDPPSSNRCDVLGSGT